MSVAVCDDVNEATLAVKPTVLAEAGTLTDAGIVTTLLLLERVTLIPLGAAADSVTVQASVPAAVIEALLHVRLLSVGCVVLVPLWPVPCSLTLAVGVLVELVVTVNCPDESPSELGLKCTFRLRVLPAASETGRFP